MWQDIITFTIPFIDKPVTIHGFGLMLVLGLFVAMACAKFLARRSGLNPEDFANAAILALLSGIIGARLSHVLENLSDYTRSDRSVWANLLDALNVSSGGLTYYGGFLLAFPTLVIYGIVRKIPIRLGMDIIAPCLMIGLGFGRLGCFLNGCCYGAECNLPWAVSFPYQSYAYQEQVSKGEIKPPQELLYTRADGEVDLIPKQTLENRAKLEGDGTLLKLAKAQRSLPLHPAQLYSTFIAFLLAGICVAFFTFRRCEGTVFALMMMLESIARFLLETVRNEPAVWRFGRYAWSFSMVMSVGLFVVGAILWLIFTRLRPTESTPRGFEPVTQP